LFETDLLDRANEKQLREGLMNIVVFKEAEKKPGLLQFGWRAPDQRGIRVLALNDGSGQLIREPAELAKPGSLAFGSTR